MHCTPDMTARPDCSTALCAASRSLLGFASPGSHVAASEHSEIGQLCRCSSHAPGNRMQQPEQSAAIMRQSNFADAALTSHLLGPVALVQTASWQHSSNLTMRWNSEMKRPRRVRSPGMVLGTRMAVSMTLASSSPAQEAAAEVQLGGSIISICLTPQSQNATTTAAGLHRVRGQDNIEQQGMLSAANRASNPDSAGQ